MACKVFQIPGGGAAILCGVREPKPKPCVYCGQPTTVLCDWPKLSYRQKAYGDLQPGELVSFWKCKNPHSKEHRRAGWKVLSVDASIRDRHGVAWAAVAFESIATGERHEFTHQREAVCFVEIIGACDVSVCREHSRHVGEDLDICVNHSLVDPAPAKPSQPGLFDPQPVAAFGLREIDKELLRRRKELLGD